MNIKTQSEGYITPGLSAWTAIDDDTYDGSSDGGSPVGWGSTEREAIENLAEQIIERLEEKVEDQRHEIRCIRAENASMRDAMFKIGETAGEKAASRQDARSDLQIQKEGQDSGQKPEAQGEAPSDFDRTLLDQEDHFWAGWMEDRGYRCQGRMQDTPEE